MRVGGLSPEASQRLLSRTGLYVDAAVIFPAEILLIEAKVEMESQALGQLLIYKDILRRTPGYSNWREEQVRLRLVTPNRKAEIEKAAARYGIEVDHFNPPWLIGYLLRLKRRRGD